MKLSKQERIAVLIIAVIVIIGLGVFLFVVPKFQAIGTDSTSLSNKQKELTEAQDRADQKVQLGEDILNAYNEGKNKADMFFEEMQAYEADNEIREFLKYCDDNGVNVFVDSLDIGDPTVSSLSIQFFEEPEVTYDLKTAAKGEDEEVSEEDVRTAILMASLGTTQTVGAIDVTFNVTALNDEEMLKFIDIINNYKKDSTRKAIRLSSSYKVEYQDILSKYEEIINDQLPDLMFDARTQLAKDTDTDAPTRDQIEAEFGKKQEQQQEGQDGQDGQPGQNDDKKTAIFEDNVEQLTVTVTMYSLERMQDPTDTLAAQEEQ